MAQVVESGSVKRMSLLRLSLEGLNSLVSFRGEATKENKVRLTPENHL